MPVQREKTRSDAALQTYLLGAVEFDAALRLQRRLHFDVSGDPSQAALLVCEHASLITVGRQGSRRHLLLDAEELQARQWRVRWVNRGGGCWLHHDGQFCVYPILPLETMNWTVPAYLQALGEVLCRVLADFSVTARVRTDDAGVWVGPRLLAAIGVAVRDGVSYYGACFNLQPPLDAYRLVRCHPRAHEPMTSLERERRGPVRASMVRERFVEHFAAHFGFHRISLFSDHPLLRAGQPAPHNQRALMSR